MVGGDPRSVEGPCRGRGNVSEEGMTTVMCRRVAVKLILFESRAAYRKGRTAMTAEVCRFGLSLPSVVSWRMINSIVWLVLVPVQLSLLLPLLTVLLLKVSTLRESERGEKAAVEARNTS